MERTSEISGFYRLTVDERRAKLRACAGLTDAGSWGSLWAYRGLAPGPALPVLLLAAALAPFALPAARFLTTRR